MYRVWMERLADPGPEWQGWIERVYASIPLSPLMVGASLAGVLLVAFFASEFALGRHIVLLEQENPIAALSDTRIAIIHCLLAGYLPTAYISLLRGYRTTLDSLRGVLDCSDAEHAELRAQIGRYGRVTLVVVGVVGLVLLLGITRLTTPAEYDPWAWNLLDQEVRWHRVLGPWLGWWAGVFTYAGVVESRRLARLATRVSEVDLLDLQPLRPFTGQALFQVLLTAGGFGIALLIMVDTGFWEAVLWWWIGSMTIIGIELAIALVPLQRVIQQKKRSELDWCGDALMRERTKLRSGNEPSRMDEIVAYRDVIKGVSAWAGDMSSSLRLSLYLLLPLGSWAGGAVVERIIDALLG